MIRANSTTRQISRLVLVPFAALLYSPSPALAQAVAPSLGAASSFAVLGGPAVTCTDNTATNTVADISGNVGVLLGSGFTNTACTITGAVHAGDGPAGAAYLSFLIAYNQLAVMNSNPLTCDTAHRLTGTLAGQVLEPGVYCVDDTAKTGLLTLDGEGDENAVWIFLVDGVADRALTGTSFNVSMIDGGQPCNVYWWVKAAATMTTSNFLGTILAGAAITVTGGTFEGRALATAAVSMTNPKITSCGSGEVPPVDMCEPPDDDDDDHHGHHGKGHHHKHGHGHHHDKDDDHGRDDDHGKGGDHGKDGDHEGNNRNNRGSRGRR